MFSQPVAEICFALFVLKAEEIQVQKEGEIYSKSPS